MDLAAPRLQRARAQYPGVPFRRASLDTLGVPAGALGGVLAWYSIIHTSPEGVDGVAAELARADPGVRPHGAISARRRAWLSP